MHGYCFDQAEYRLAQAAPLLRLPCIHEGSQKAFELGNHHLWFSHGIWEFSLVRTGLWSVGRDYHVVAVFQTSWLSSYEAPLIILGAGAVVYGPGLSFPGGRPSCLLDTYVPFQQA